MCSRALSADEKHPAIAQLLAVSAVSDVHSLQAARGLVPERPASLPSLKSLQHSHDSAPTIYTHVYTDPVSKHTVSMRIHTLTRQLFLYLGF